MSSREIFKTSTSSCTWKTGTVEASLDRPWQRCFSNDNGVKEGSLPCIHLNDGITLKVSAMDRNAKWKDTHFHENLKLLPISTSSGMVVLFQAKAREGIAVALSSAPEFVNDKCFYEVQFGAKGNTVTTISRRPSRAGTKDKKNSKRNDNATLSFPSRVCHDSAWISYWICFDNGKIHVGIGTIPGQECVGFLDDTETYTQQPQPNDNDETTTTAKAAIQYVGLGNVGRRPPEQHGHQQLLSIQNICLLSMPLFLQEQLASLPADLPLVYCTTAAQPSDTTSSTEITTKALLEEYQRECRIRKARAEKYGTEYQEPPPEAFLPWSQAKRLRQNPEKGFITGMDLMDPTELAKKEARKSRFGGSSNNNSDGQTTDLKVEQENDSGAKLESAPEGTMDEVMEDGSRLPPSQSWDKEELLLPYRQDPPAILWRQPPVHSEQSTTANRVNDFMREPPKPVTWTPDKLHLFALDWAAFKQIRNKDIMAHFSIYGPTYVEWLGDLSCNLCFEDKFTASRALQNVSQEIPSPPTTTESDQSENYKPSDLANMGWRFCLQPIQKIANDRHGRKGTIARVLMRVALSTDILEVRNSSWPEPPAGFSATQVLGPESDIPKEEGRRGGDKKKRGRGKGAASNGSSHINTSGSKDSRNNGSKKAANDDGESLVGRGLSARRDGFSVEEMEQERARKRAKQEGVTNGQ